MSIHEDVKHFQYLIRHIRHVQDNCMVLGEKLIENGEFHLGRNLIANAMLHDNSKFHGMEWDLLRKDGDNTNPTFIAAVKQHNHTNAHHPESWGGIKNMPDVYLAEFTCDTVARSGEFGSSYQEWLDGVATARYGFTKSDDVYCRIMRFVQLLLDKSFK
jgi:hypothetical protein